VRFVNFGVIGLNGRRGDHHVRVYHIAGFMPVKNGGAQVLQALGDR
jgi:hypothetical protein